MDAGRKIYYELSTGNIIINTSEMTLGVATGIFYVSPDDPKQAILVDIVMGLAASGLWSGAKNIVRK
ncbi:hypothetical protein [Chengkuizengella sediminis]|uniref:hypothetical protein n=1 Tax=Chengkuizengella sediminis TaxID=1885917 RepID=UPI0013894D61|nr:hypothetical protein [Chengkuizengella sediminis]NDI35662.1 hypothetical protein [Chengkuizengella sediminis]